MKRDFPRSVLFLRWQLQDRQAGLGSKEAGKVALTDLQTAFTRGQISFIESFGWRHQVRLAQ
jgi:hypothetical protein